MNVAENWEIFKLATPSCGWELLIEVFYCRVGRFVSTKATSPKLNQSHSQHLTKLITSCIAIMAWKNIRTKTFFFPFCISSLQLANVTKINLCQFIRQNYAHLMYTIQTLQFTFMRISSAKEQGERAESFVLLMQRVSIFRHARQLFYWMPEGIRVCVRSRKRLEGNSKNRQTIEKIINSEGSK